MTVIKVKTPIIVLLAVMKMAICSEALNLVSPEEYPSVMAQTRDNPIVPSDTDIHAGAPGDFGKEKLSSSSVHQSELEMVLDPESRTATPNKTVYWDPLDFPWGIGNPYPYVPFSYLDTKVPLSTIDAAVAEYKKHTCITMGHTWPLHLGPKVKFVKGDGCSSSIGRRAYIFGQDIWLNEGCNTVDIVIHEIAHALGLYHEQNRSDRDGFLSILESNILSDFVHNYGAAKTENYNTSYDPLSVMQYGFFGFSNGSSTMAANDPFNQGLMVVPRAGFSFMDKLIINEMYGCTTIWLKECGVVSNPCQNKGYINSACKCECPLGTSGDKCETKEAEYLDALRAIHLPLNENITSATTVSTPGYPSPNEATVIFTKIVKAPTCQRVVLTITDFELDKRVGRNYCYFEGLEIGLDEVAANRQWYCDKELTKDQVIKSQSNYMYIFYMRSDNIKTKGFSLDITFEAIDGCSKVNKHVKRSSKMRKTDQN